MKTEVTPSPTPMQQRVDKSPSVLCLLDFLLGNLKIHYSKTRVLHPRQGIDDVLEVVREENLLFPNIRVVYFLVGRADVHLSSSCFGKALDQLLCALWSLNPRLMLILGGIVMTTNDTEEQKVAIGEKNQRLARMADKDPHLLFFNPNIGLSLAGAPQKRFFDKDSKINNQGCAIIARGLVAAAKNGRLHQNYSALAPKAM